MPAILKPVRKMQRAAMAKLFPIWWKQKHELAFWRDRAADEGALRNDHYVQFYTDHFELSRTDYTDKRVLDIGCGPRGSLEWADLAALRVGLDPLADEYLKLGADRHTMSYVNAPSEAIPFPNGHFDIVCSFNSLDHVADLDQTIDEIKRVTAAGGLFLLITDVNHDPTPCEPISFSWDIRDRFAPEFQVLSERHHEKGAPGVYDSILQNIPYDHDDMTRRYGITSLKFRRG